MTGYPAMSFLSPQLNSNHNIDQKLDAEIARYAENLRRLKNLLEGLRPELEQRRAELHAGLTKYAHLSLPPGSLPFG